jgi:hypothetical protein
MAKVTALKSASDFADKVRKANEMFNMKSQLSDALKEQKALCEDSYLDLIRNPRSALKLLLREKDINRELAEKLLKFVLSKLV